MRRQKVIFFALYAVVAVLLPLRVPMVIPHEIGEEWKDVWIWDAFSEPTAQRPADMSASEVGFRPAYPQADLKGWEILTDIAPVRRWDAVSEREAGLIFLGFALYLLVFRYRGLTRAAGVLFATNPEKGFLALFLLSTVPLLCVPPCQFVRTFGGYEGSARIQRIDSSYLPIWSRGNYQIDYGALLVEILALAACFGGLYLIFCAIRAVTRKRMA